MGIQRAVAFGRRHTWPFTVGAGAMIAISICGIALAVSAWNHGWYLAGYFGGAACGDVLIWGVTVLAALWLPRKGVQTT